MRKSLTDTFCKSTPAPAKGRSEFADVRCSGLEFRVTAAGARTWTFRFRDPTTRRTLRASLGSYPDVGLSAARKKADALRGKVADGVNPIDAKRQERSESQSRTFETLAKRYMDEHARRHKRPRSIEEDERNLNKHVLPKWKKRDYRKIRRADAIDLIEAMVAAGTHTAANRVHALISKVFSFAVDSDLLEANPVARLQKRGKEKTGHRILSDDELALFWRKIVHSPVTRPVGLALRLCLLTAGRENEICGVRLDEIKDLDGDDAALKIPGSRTKNKRDYLIPLTPLAVETIKQAKEMVSDGSEYLFMSTRKKGRPIDRHSLPVAMARFCAALDGKAGAAKSLRADPPSPHDLRRTAATRMSALGVPKEDRDACLNHARVDVGKHYDLYERAAEKRRALQLLARAITEIVAGGQDASTQKAAAVERASA
jgi:integrase